MLQICPKEQVLNAIQAGHIDAADMSFPNLIDTIMLAMKQHDFLLPLRRLLKTNEKVAIIFPWTSFFPFLLLQS